MNSLLFPRLRYAYLFYELARSVSDSMLISDTPCIMPRLGITKQGDVRGRHAPTSSLFLTALSREYPPNPPYVSSCAPASNPLDTSRYSFGIPKPPRGSISPTWENRRRPLPFYNIFRVFFDARLIKGALGDPRLAPLENIADESSTY